MQTILAPGTGCNGTERFGDWLVGEAGETQGCRYFFKNSVCVRVSVTIQNGKMTDIAVLDASGEDKPYYKQALPLLDEMLAVQSAEVDTVSGATLTAEGLIGAVENALGKAAG